MNTRFLSPSNKSSAVFSCNKLEYSFPFLPLSTGHTHSEDESWMCLEIFGSWISSVPGMWFGKVIFVPLVFTHPLPGTYIAGVWQRFCVCGRQLYHPGQIYVHVVSTRTCRNSSTYTCNPQATNAPNFIVGWTICICAEPVRVCVCVCVCSEFVCLCVRIYLYAYPDFSSPVSSTQKKVELKATYLSDGI